MEAVTTFRYDASSKVIGQTGPAAKPFGRCLLALEEGQITLRDLDLLRELAYSQYLTKLQIQALTMQGVSKSVLRRRLEVLTQLGLIHAVRWEEPRTDQEPSQRVAYCLALHGAKLLRHYHGASLPWRPGLAQRHLRRILAVLAANEFRVHVFHQRPTLLAKWEVFTHPVGPVARFRLGEQLVLLEAPRDEDDVHQLNAQRYSRWQDQAPLLFFLTPDEPLATATFNRLKDSLATDHLLFSTDQRAFETPVESTGFIWQWESGGRALSMALA